MSTFGQCQIFYKKPQLPSFTKLILELISVKINSAGTFQVLTTKKQCLKNKKFFSKTKKINKKSVCFHKIVPQN